MSAPENDGWDPEDPDLLRAQGTGKKQGGWLGWVLAFTVVGGMVAAWFLARGDR